MVSRAPAACWLREKEDGDDDECHRQSVSEAECAPILRCWRASYTQFHARIFGAKVGCRPSGYNKETSNRYAFRVILKCQSDSKAHTAKAATNSLYGAVEIIPESSGCW